MPFYHAHVRPGLLDLDGRAAFSGDVVDIHCGVTGAPPSFVHLYVTEDSSGSLPDGVNGAINGTIRFGRTGEQKAEICDRMAAALAGHGGVEASTITAATRDVQASFTMEGGVLLPEPGSAEEEAWKAAG
ncbi:MAG: hypothetical protein AAGC53_01470 [Actinomycetota bacterium]